MDAFLNLVRMDMTATVSSNAALEKKTVVCFLFRDGNLGSTRFHTTQFIQQRWCLMTDKA